MFYFVRFCHIFDEYIVLTVTTVRYNPNKKLKCFGKQSFSTMNDLHCKVNLAKISYKKKFCRISANLGLSFQLGSTAGAIDYKQGLQTLFLQKLFYLAKETFFVSENGFQNSLITPFDYGSFGEHNAKRIIYSSFSIAAKQF